MNSYKPQKLWVVAIDRHCGKTFADLSQKYVNDETLGKMKLEGIALFHDPYDLDQYVESQNREELDFVLLLSQGANEKLLSKSKLDSLLFQRGTTNIGRKWYYVHQRDRKQLGQYYSSVRNCDTIEHNIVGSIPEIEQSSPTPETEAKFCLNMLQDLSFEYGISDKDVLRRTYICIARKNTCRYVVESPMDHIWDCSADIDESDLCGCGCFLSKADHDRHKTNAVVFYSRTDQNKICKQSVENVSIGRKNSPHVHDMARWLTFMDKVDFEELGEKVIQRRDLGRNCLAFIPYHIQKLWGESAAGLIEYAMYSLFLMMRVLASDEGNNWQNRTLVLFGESGCGKSSFARALCSMFYTSAAFSIERREQDLAFVMADASGKRVALIDDVMEDGWKLIVHTLGLPISMNRKYGSIVNARFPRSILTINFSKNDVESLFSGDAVKAAQISLKRFQTWIEMFPTVHPVDISPKNVQYVLYHLLQQLIIKVCGEEYYEECRENSAKYAETLTAFTTVHEKDMYRFIFFTDCCNGDLRKLSVKSDNAWKKYLLARCERVCEISRRAVLAGAELPSRLTRRLIRQEFAEASRSVSYAAQAAAEKWIQEMENELNELLLSL